MGLSLQGLVNSWKWKSVFLCDGIKLPGIKQNQIDPSDLVTRTTGAVQGLWLCSITFLSSIFRTFLSMANILTGETLGGGILIGPCFPESILHSSTFVFPNYHKVLQKHLKIHIKNSLTLSFTLSDKSEWMFANRGCKCSSKILPTLVGKYVQLQTQAMGCNEATTLFFLRCVFLVVKFRTENKLSFFASIFRTLGH